MSLEVLLEMLQSVFQLTFSSRFITDNNLTFQNAEGRRLTLLFYFRPVL